MKNTSKIIGTLLLTAAAATSCVDESLLPYDVPAKPGSLADYEYLNEYDVLKTYINRDAHPNFKVSAALEAGDYLANGEMTRIANTNFDEIVAGNAMKMGSVVDDKGNMKFDDVTAFVDAADAAGLTVYGHTLLWHAQQPVKWLNKLIADKPMPTPEGPTETKEDLVADVTYTDGGFPFYPMGCEPPVQNGAIHFEPSGDWSQFFITNAIKLDEGNYKAVLTIQSSKEGSIKLTTQNGWSDAQQMDGTVELKTEMTDVEVKFKDTFVGGNYDFILKPEMFDGVLDVKGLKIYKLEEVAAGPELHEEYVEVAKTTYTDGGFPFYPMGCEPPVENGALHFTPTGDWSQFFITNAIKLDEGEYVAKLRIKASKTGTIKLTTQNGWSDAQQMDGSVDLSTDWTEVVVKYKDTFVGGNYDFILKPEMFDGEIWVEYLSVCKVEMVAGPVAKEVAKTTYTDGGFPFYPMGCEPPVENGALHFTPTGDWSQFFITNAIKLDEGEYSAIVRIKASKTGSIKLTTQNGWSDAQQMDGNVDLPTEWADVEVKYKDAFVGGNYDFILKPEMFDGEIWVESLTIVKYEAPAAPGVEVEKTFTEKKPTLVVTASDKINEAWDTQFWFRTNDEFSDGDSYEVSMDVRADLPASATTQVHGEPGDYHYYIGIGDVNFSPEWETYKSSGKLQTDGKGGRTIAFNLNEFAGANKYYFRNISLKINGIEQITNGNLATDDNSAFFSKESKGVVDPTIFNTAILPQITYTKMVNSNTIPLTPEEKKDTLIYALNQWMTGMMNATSGKVKAWDLINEAFDGAGGLQHGEEGDDQNFFWQDYLGDEEYGVIASKLAREAWEAVEGNNPNDLKLFINDYNLEWQTAKLDGMLRWIETWEAAGAKIDGIGSQMHISLYKNPADHEKQKKGITDMLTKMANTGKLVRISELDMGITDKEFGKGQTTITLEEEKMMADFYQWIVEEYFRVVPRPQQYGICQWCITDAPAGSGWRGGEPVGLWYRQDYTRKPAYAGWAEGLKNAK